MSLRESPVLDIIELLHNKGAEVIYHYPYIPHICEQAIEMNSVDLLIHEVEASNCVTIIIDHSDYDYAYILKHAQCVMDARNATRKFGRKLV